MTKRGAEAVRPAVARSRRRRLAQIVVWLALAAQVGLALFIPAVRLNVVLVYLLWLPVVAVHEGGHLLAGWAVGFRFRVLTVGPLRIAREGGRLRLSLFRGLPAG